MCFEDAVVYVQDWELQFSDQLRFYSSFNRRESVCKMFIWTGGIRSFLLHEAMFSFLLPVYGGCLWVWSSLRKTSRQGV